MRRLYKVVAELNGKEILRTEPMEIHLANIRIKEFQDENKYPGAVIWKETESRPFVMPQSKAKRSEGKSEQEKTVEKYLK